MGVAPLVGASAGRAKLLDCVSISERMIFLSFCFLIHDMGLA